MDSSELAMSTFHASSISASCSCSLSGLAICTASRNAEADSPGYFVRQSPTMTRNSVSAAVSHWVRFPFQQPPYSFVNTARQWTSPPATAIACPTLSWPMSARSWFRSSRSNLATDALLPIGWLGMTLAGMTKPVAASRDQLVRRGPLAPVLFAPTGGCEAGSRSSPKSLQGCSERPSPSPRQSASPRRPRLNGPHRDGCTTSRSCDLRLRSGAHPERLRDHRRDLPQGRKGVVLRLRVSRIVRPGCGNRHHEPAVLLRDGHGGGWPCGGRGHPFLHHPGGGLLLHPGAHALLRVGVQLATPRHEKRARAAAM